MEHQAYRCCLPTLAGFAGNHCIGPGFQRRPAVCSPTPPPPRGIPPSCSGLLEQGTATSPPSTTKSLKRSWNCWRSFSQTSFLISPNDCPMQWQNARLQREQREGHESMKRESRGSLSVSGPPILIGAGSSLFKRLMRGSLGSPTQHTPFWAECNRLPRSTHFPCLRLHISPDCGFFGEEVYCACCLKGGCAMRSRERLPAAEVLSKIWMSFGIAFWLGVGAFLIWRLIA